MSVLVLTDAQAYLNISPGPLDYELQATIDAAEAVIAKLCGPLASTATTSRVEGCGTKALVLPVTPAVSLTSVTPVNGTALTLSDLYLNTLSGVVTYTVGYTFPALTYDVVYNAGRTTCPSDLLLAVKELVRHLWQTRRGPTRRPGSDASDALANTIPGAAYLLPFRVTELIAPHLQPGFA